MRIWDISLDRLCRQHLLGEHRELHAIWTIITKNKKGYACHPETMRWRGKLRALYLRHDAQVAEMKRRGYNHASPLDETLATGKEVQEEHINTVEEQLQILRSKGCSCETW